MPKSKTHMIDFCEEKARTGDGSFAIAYALLELADKHQSLAKALDSIGLNTMNAAGPPGALENIGMQLRDLIQRLPQAD